MLITFLDSRHPLLQSYLTCMQTVASKGLAKMELFEQTRV